LFKGIIQNWITDFKENPLLFWLELIGILGGMIAAGLLALTVPTPPFFLIYTSYIIGSSCLAASSYIRNNGFWVILSCFFIMIDVIGLTHLIMSYHLVSKFLGVL
jgi:hypothetical protein